MPLHVYGVTSADVALPDDLTGVHDEPVVQVVDGDLAALVTDSPEPPVARRAELLAHSRVLERLAETDTVLPAQFGMSIPDADAVRRELLAAHAPTLRQQIGDLADTLQVTVKVVYREDDALREVLRRSPRLVEMRDRLAGVPAGAAHFKQAEFGQIVATSLEQLGREDAAGILDRLVPLSVAHDEGRHVSAYHVLNSAFLVRRDAREDFDQAVGSVAEQWQARCQLRYLGPQPPYSFVDLQTGDPAWA